MVYLQEKYNFLKPLKNNNLIRAGIEKDGGYIVDSVLFKNAEHLLSFGMGDDWSFELDYIKINKKGNITIYDHSVSFFTFFKPLIKVLKRYFLFRKTFCDLQNRFHKLKEYLNFTNNKKVNFYQEKISKKKNNKFKTTSVTKAFQKLGEVKSLILKIDIEGYEYEIIDEILANHKKIDMLILEFHNIDLKEENFIVCMKRLTSYFNVIHLHGNNHCGQCTSGIPIALEITMINKMKGNKELVYEKNFPRLNLDFPNNPYKKDIFFSFK